MDEESLDATYNKLFSLAKKMNTESSEEIPEIKNAVDTWKNFFDSEYIPLRLEQSVLHGFLSNEQLDLTVKNEVLVDHQKAQLRVIDRIVSDFHNKGFSSMRNYQSIDYKINNIISNIGLIKYSSILLSIICMVVGFNANGVINASVGAAIGAVAVLIYIAIVILRYRQKLFRHKYDWNKMYWTAPVSQTN